MAQKASLYDLVGDLVVYRNIDPVDPRLPRFSDAWQAMGLASPERPRKQEPAYAQALTWLIRRARALHAQDVEIEELLFLGDTAMSDAGAFRSLRAAGGWRGWAFIGSERDEELAVNVKDGVYYANRWAALAEFVFWAISQGAILDTRTAVVVDIDKTALAARGRNNGPIDQARVAAIEATVAEALAADFDRAAFRKAYVTLGDPKYHPFTADNQDNLAYICLMLSAGVSTLDALLAELAAGQITSFREFMDWVDAIRDDLPSPALRALHAEIYTLVKAGDPTPFKAFRRRELQETVERMGSLPDDAPLAQRLVREICLTREVVEVVEWLRNRGCLVMALSDKPDEATMPTPELAARGYLPLHRVETHIIGQSLSDLLPNG